MLELFVCRNDKAGCRTSKFLVLVKFCMVLHCFCKEFNEFCMVLYNFCMVFCRFCVGLNYICMVFNGFCMA
jgi:hypothetical protein